VAFAADAGGGWLVVVDAIDDAGAAYFRHFAFRGKPGTMRLSTNL